MKIDQVISIFTRNVHVKVFWQQQTIFYNQCNKKVLLWTLLLLCYVQSFFYSPMVFSLFLLLSHVEEPLIYLQDWVFCFWFINVSLSLASTDQVKNLFLPTTTGRFDSGSWNVLLSVRMTENVRIEKDKEKRRVDCA